MSEDTPPIKTIIKRRQPRGGRSMMPQPGGRAIEEDAPSYLDPPVPSRPAPGRSVEPRGVQGGAQTTAPRAAPVAERNAPVSGGAYAVEAEPDLAADGANLLLDEANPMLVFGGYLLGAD
ncbi:MAG: hypothetical protein AAFX85_08060, partial [Pseudomonadota bacterium]